MSFLARSSLLTHGHFARRALVARAAAIHARGVASSVSARPGSQTLPHAAQNIKEEVGNSASDFATSVAAGPLNVGKLAGGGNGFLGVTSKVAASVPPPVMVFGLAGALPYLGTSLTSVYLASQAGNAASGLAGVSAQPELLMAAMNQCLHVQATYGAALLSFLGAIHWGMEFAGYGGHIGARRLALGVAPVLVAWPTLLLEPTTAIIAQWATFTALWGADQRMTSLGYAPPWYSQYRFYLSILVGTCMIGTLAGTSYLGPRAGHGFTTRDLQRMRKERHQQHKESEGVVKGVPIEALPAEQDSNAFVLIRKNEPPKEKDGKKDEKDETKDGKKVKNDETKDENKGKR